MGPLLATALVGAGTWAVLAGEERYGVVAETTGVGLKTGFGWWVEAREKIQRGEGLALDHRQTLRDLAIVIEERARGGGKVAASRDLARIAAGVTHGELARLCTVWLRALGAREAPIMQTWPGSVFGEQSIRLQLAGHGDAVINAALAVNQAWNQHKSKPADTAPLLDGAGTWLVIRNLANAADGAGLWADGTPPPSTGPSWGSVFWGGAAGVGGALGLYDDAAEVLVDATTAPLKEMGIYLIAALVGVVLIGKALAPTAAAAVRARP